MNETIDTISEHTRIRLIAAAIGHQQCTKTAANMIPIPGSERVIVIGTPAKAAELLAAGAVPRKGDFKEFLRVPLEREVEQADSEGGHYD